MNRRISSLLRLRQARIMLRNAAGGRLAEAEAAVRTASLRLDDVRADFERLKAEAPARFRRIREVGDLLKFDMEREANEATIAEANAEFERVAAIALEVRRELAKREQELRRVERVLAQAKHVRRMAEKKAEQRTHDDLVNHDVHEQTTPGGDE